MNRAGRLIKRYRQVESLIETEKDYLVALIEERVEILNAMERILKEVESDDNEGDCCESCGEIRRALGEAGAQADGGRA